MYPYSHTKKRRAFDHIYVSKGRRFIVLFLSIEQIFVMISSLNRYI